LRRYNDRVTQAIDPETLQRVRRVQAITVAWMSIEAAVSLFAAWQARSPALLAFGGDSAIELASAVVVLWSFRANVTSEDAARHAARIAGVLLFALAACVIAVSIMALLGCGEPRPTLLGIGILIAAAVFMPLLARKKRRLSAITGSAALRADAAESAFCGYLSLIALFGLLIKAVWHMRWADPAAALVTVPLILREGWEAVQGKPCECG
jgi:divalent metal cation (Fe/Co/Zn/Cd) transporter